MDPLKASRRSMLPLPLLALPRPARARAVPAVEPRPLLDQPMRRLRLPKGTLGRDYIIVELKVAGRGPYDFMIDTGLTAEMITPHLRQSLGIPPSRRGVEGAFGAGGGVVQLELVTLEGARLVGADDTALPPLTAVVTDFLQEHMDPAHDPVEGMLGMELLQEFDLDLDFPAQRLRLFHPGDGIAAAGRDPGLVEVPAAVLNETGVLGIRVTSPQAAAARGGGNGRGLQPFVGVLDCGASFSAINWQGAALAGLPPKDDAAFWAGARAESGSVTILGVDGQPQVLPLAPLQLTWVGDVTKDGNQLRFAPPPAAWRPWQPVLAAVGDLPAFSQLVGDGRSPYAGPAALIGLDVLAQRRVVLGAGAGRRGRARQLFVSAV